MRLARKTRKLVALDSESLRHPLYVRPGTSDAMVFIEVIQEGDYAPLYSLDGVTSIIDLGANIGCSAAAFLTHFPAARLIALEPDEGNFSLLRANLAPYGDRVTCLNAGIWNRPADLEIVESPYRDGGNWSRQVRECPSGTKGSVKGLDVPSLIAMSGEDRVSILKVDIEGAEVMLFDNSCSSWIDRVDNIAIELHDDSAFGMASPIFWSAVARRGFRFSKWRGLVMRQRT